MSECVSGCSIRAEHVPGCSGVADGQECPGCLPCPASHGLLCSWCWGRLQQVVRSLPDVVSHLRQVAEPSTSCALGRGGAGSRARLSERGLWHPALDLVDELHACLAVWCDEVAAERPGLSEAPRVSRMTDPSRGDRVPFAPLTDDATEVLAGWLLPHLEWVSCQTWAGELLDDLGSRSRRAMARFPEEDRERVVTTVRCPSCHALSLVLVPPAAAGADLHARCTLRSCGALLTEGEWDRLLADAVAEAREADQCR